MTMVRKILYFTPALICCFFIAVSCVTTETDTPTVPVQTRDNTAGITLITQNGGHLAWSKEHNKIAFDRLGKDKYFVVPADFDWSPDGNRIAALVLTNRPETKNRGSGINVMIDLPEK